MASKVAVAEAKLSRMHHRQEAFLRRHRDIHGQVRPDIWRSGIEHVRGTTTLETAYRQLIAR